MDAVRPAESDGESEVDYSHPHVPSSPRFCGATRSDTNWTRGPGLPHRLCGRVEDFSGGESSFMILSLSLIDLSCVRVSW